MTRTLAHEDIKARLNQIAHGCNQSAEVLYRQYSSGLYAFVRMRIPNDEAAEELVNDTFMIAFQKAAAFNGTSSFKTWLCGIAKNLCGTWIRKQRSRGAGKNISMDHDEDLFSEVEGKLADYRDAQALLEEAELDEALLLCIDKLPGRQKETLHWAWFEELSIAEVAQQMSCSQGTVKAQLFNARNKVMNCLRSAFGLELACA